MSKKTRIEKNLGLSAEFNSYLLKNPDIVEKLRKSVCIIFEVKTDKDLSRANLKVAEELPNRKDCMVASKSGSRWSLRPLVGA